MLAPLVGGLGGSPHYSKNWLIPPYVPNPTALFQNCWYCNFHAGFGYFTQTVKERNVNERVQKRKNKYNIRKLCFGILISALYCFSGDNTKYGLLWKHLFKKNSNMAVEKHQKVIWTLMKKQCLPMITFIEAFTAATIKVCDLFLYGQNRKTCSILWSVWVFFAFLGKRRPNKK